MTVAAINSNNRAVVSGCQRTEDSSKLVGGPGLGIVANGHILSAADDASLSLSAGSQRCVLNPPYVAVNL